MSLRALASPHGVEVSCAPDGTPVEVALDAGRPRRVMTVRDDWLVQDLWWTDRAIDRHYFELVLDTGRLVVVYRDGPGGTWFAHR